MINSFNKYWPWFFFTAAFESLLAVVALLLVPSEGGFSLARISLFAILLSFFFTGIYLGFIARRDSSRFDSFSRTSFILSSALLSLTSSLFLFLLRYLNPERLLPYYERLSPLLWYLLALGIQSLIFLLLLKNGFHTQEIYKRKADYTSSLVAFCLLLSVFFFVIYTKLGIKPDTGYWGEPGVAILGWHFVLSILIGFFILIYQLQITDPPHTNVILSDSEESLPMKVRDSSVAKSAASERHGIFEGDSSHRTARFENIFLPFTLYIIAAILWLSVPVDVLQNSFYAPISPPANMPFPYSDAGFYDYLSQSLLIGAKYLGGIPPRPLYVLFLAILHFIFGQNYPAIITAQTLVLALFPVTLYFLGKKLHSPAAGVIVALFTTFRELVGLWISSNTRVANSKIFTTDFPTAMALAVLCLVFIWWLERRDFKSTMVAGGFFGLILLFRTQSLLVLPVVFLLAWFVYQRKLKDWIMAGIIFAISMSLTVLPWLTHNYTVVGQFTFDDPRQTAIIYSQYSFTGNLDLSQFDPEKQSVGKRIVSFTLENPAYVAGFITSHILNTEIGGLLALPLIERFDSLAASINLYWVTWDGTLAWYNLVLLIIYLAIIAIGFGAVWRHAGWIGLLPLAVNLGYTLANGISRFSSWRYNLPVDWVIYFYFAIGATEILSGLTLLFGAKPATLESGSSLPDKQNDEEIASSQRTLLSKTLPTGRITFILLAFIFIGSLPWLAEGLAKPRYTSSQEQLTEKLVSSGYDSKEVRFFLSQPDAILMEGRMLYPRMYRRTEGLASSNPWAAYAVRDYARIGFILINDHRYDLIFPTKDVLDFPQGADVVVLACQREKYLEVLVIDFGDKSFQSAPLSQTCN